MQRIYVNITRVVPLILILLFFVISFNYYISAQVFPGYSLYDIKRILEVGLIGSAIVVLLFFPHLQTAVLQTYCRLPTINRFALFVFFILGITSSLMAPRSTMALMEVALYSLLFLFVLLIAAQHSLWGERIDAIMTGLIIFTTVVYLAVCVPAYFHQLIKIHNIRYLSPGFMNTRFFAQYAVWSLPLLTLPALLTKKRPLSVVLPCVLLTTLWWALVIANGSNGLIVSLVTAYIVGLIYFRHAIRFFLSLQIISALVGLAIVLLSTFWLQPLLLHSAISSHPDISIITNTSVSNLGKVHGALHERLLLWRHTMHLIIQKPLLGVGPMHLAHYHIGINTHPHNALLLIAGEWGIPACLILLSLYIYGAYCWLRHISINPTTLSLTIAWFAGSFYSLMSGIIVMPLSQMMLCFIAGWMLGIYQRTNKKSLENKLIHGSVLFAVGIIACVFLVWNVSTQMNHLSQREINWALTNGKYVGFSPRFWLQGWI